MKLIYNLNRVIWHAYLVHTSGVCSTLSGKCQQFHFTSAPGLQRLTQDQLKNKLCVTIISSVTKTPNKTFFIGVQFNKLFLNLFSDFM
jgi:hypothetical protein